MFRLFASTAVLSLIAIVTAQAASPPPAKLLLVSVTTGFRHDSIPTGERVLEQIGRESGLFTLDFVRQPPGQPVAPAAPRRPADSSGSEEVAAAQRGYEAELKAFEAKQERWMQDVAAALRPLHPDALRTAGYDGVIFLSTSGDLPLPDKEGFMSWLAEGRAFIGIHGASTTLRGFPPFLKMLGADFMQHGPQVRVDILNQDPSHPACAHLPPAWSVYEEIYEFRSFERDRVHGLLGMEQHPQNGSPGDFPLAWTRVEGASRIFYTALGHRHDVWDVGQHPSERRMNPPETALAFQQHLLGGIRWALGRENAAGRAVD